MKAQEDKVEVFADPTYDTTFKMLFGTEKNKDILVSLLNSLLGFKDEKEIVDVTISCNDLEVEGASDIKGAVDVLCTTKNKQKVAVEMQRKYKDYFLPRSQEYMSKIIASQVKEGEGEHYDTAVMDTYILAIGKQNIFRGKYELTNKKIFEATVVPIVVETGEEMPGNKMHWKFFELPKFASLNKSKTIDTSSSLKEQWLDFLLKCNTKTEIPDDVSEIIKKGYNIMKTANWTEDQRLLYWKQRSNEKEEIREQKLLEEKIFKEGKLEGFEEGIYKGIKQEKAKFQAKSEIKEAKKGLTKFKIEPDKMVEELEFKFLKTEHVNYIKDHLAETESVIGDNLHLFDMDIE